MIYENVIITARSVITNDVPSNSVVRGNPARYVCSFKDYYKLRINQKNYPDDMKHMMGQELESYLEVWLWDDFKKAREKLFQCPLDVKNLFRTKRVVNLN